MKTKLLGVVAAGVLVLTVSTAKATTYTVESTIFPSVTTSCPFPKVPDTCAVNAANWLSFSGRPGPITGTVSIDDGLLTGIDLSLVTWVPGHVIPFTYSPRSILSFINPDEWNVVTQDCYVACLNKDVLSLSDNYGLLTATYAFSDDDPEVPDLFFSGATGTIDAPLPAALPLFATGLAGLGLLGWRRRRFQ
jgi:hypothetical protein